LENRLKIFNIWVDLCTRKDSIQLVDEFIKSGHRPRSIFAANPEKNYQIKKDPLLYNVFRSADLLIPDGMGIVLAARLLYGIKLIRIPGIELMEDICELAAQEGHGVFIYGAKEEVNEIAVDILERRYPGLKVAGRFNGYVKEEDMSDLVNYINESRAEILFLALGSPRQEKWFARYKHSLKHIKVCQGIGGTLDVITGNVKRAPVSWQKYGLEWLYRLFCEPRRLKRQKVLPVFAIEVLIARLRILLKIHDKL
jgi:N-acetylglucosaminyldiphosphoundecaprenol N-acetyl-beta-D-mannosaminyltransferase